MESMSDLLLKNKRKQAFNGMYRLDVPEDNREDTFPVGQILNQNKDFCCCAMGAILEESGLLFDVPLESGSQVCDLLRSNFPQTKDWLKLSDISNKLCKAGLKEEAKKISNYFRIYKDLTEVSLFSFIAYINDQVKLDFKTISKVLKAIGY